MRVLLAAGCIFALALGSTGSVEASNGTFGRVVSQARLPGLLAPSEYSLNSVPLASASPLLVPVADPEHQQVAAAQLRLHSLGLYDGTTNGTLGPRTRAALSNYQAQRGLPVTGQLDGSTQYALANDDLLRICLARGSSATDCLGAIAQFNAMRAQLELSTLSPAAGPEAGQACEAAKDISACTRAVAEMKAWFNTLSSSQAQDSASPAAPVR
jgi:hypothetical protein